ATVTLPALPTPEERTQAITTPSVEPTAEVPQPSVPPPTATEPSPTPSPTVSFAEPNPQTPTGQNRDARAEHDKATPTRQPARSPRRSSRCSRCSPGSSWREGCGGWRTPPRAGTRSPRGPTPRPGIRRGRCTHR